MLSHKAVLLRCVRALPRGLFQGRLISPTGAAALYKVLCSFDPAVKEGAQVDLEQTYDNRFVERALQGRP
jgi:hypothetical protein